MYIFCSIPFLHQEFNGQKILAIVSDNLISPPTCFPFQIFLARKFLTLSRLSIQGHVISLLMK